MFKPMLKLMPMPVPDPIPMPTLDRSPRARPPRSGRPTVRPGSPALAAVVCLLPLWLAACGGGGAAGPELDSGSPALKPSAPGDLTTYVQRVLRERAVQRAAGGAAPEDRTPTIAPAPPLAAAPATAPVFSTSLTQERDVDEPDLLKTDGTHLLSLDLQDRARPQLRITRRTASGGLEERAAVPLGVPVVEGTPGMLSPHGLLLGAQAQTLAVASDVWVGAGGNPCADLCPPALLPVGPAWMRQQVTVERFDAADPARPISTTRLEFDGRLIGARQVGQQVIIVSEHRPLLAADRLPLTATAGEREAAIAATRGADLLPRQRNATGAATPLMQDSDCWVQPANASLALAVTTLTVLDLRERDFAPVHRCFIGGTEAMYLTPQSIYLASTRWPVAVLGGGALRFPQEMRTDLHKFGLDAAGRPAYRASGSVPGHLGWDTQRKSFRLSEHQGALRVLTFTGATGWAALADASTTPPSPATVTVLREGSGAAAGTLATVATLPNERRPQAIGKPGEQVFGVRFVGARGYAVTFRQIDPLYVLDLADAADPRIAGVLEVPGFSDHLVPLSERLLLGVGKDADPRTGRVGGVRVALFDVADAAQPRELASRVYGAAGSQSALDVTRQGLALLRLGDTVRASLPLTLLDSGFTNLREGLLRLEVDLAAGRLADKPLLGAPTPAPSWSDLSQQRSALVGEQVYWLYAGRLGGYAW